MCLSRKSLAVKQVELEIDSADLGRLVERYLIEVLMELESDSAIRHWVCQRTWTRKESTKQMKPSENNDKLIYLGHHRQ